MVRLYSRPDSPYWYAEIDVRGVTFRVSTGVPRGSRNRGHAREAAEAERERREALHIAETSVVFTQLVGLYFERVQGLKDSTKRHYHKKIVPVLEILGREPIVTITPARLKAYIQERRPETSDIQVRRELTAASSIFEWAVDNDYLEVNPVRLVKTKHLGRPSYHPRALSPPDLRHLLAVARETSPGFWEPFITLALETGMRHEELLSLEWKFVDLERGMIYLPWENEKTSRGRIIPISDTALNTLRTVCRYEASPWVFTNRRTMSRYVSIWKGWGSLRDKAGLPHVRIHDLRHTFASYTRRLGMDALDRRAVMGHSSEESHALYAATDERALRRVLNAHSPSTLLTQDRELSEDEAEKANEINDGV